MSHIQSYASKNSPFPAYTKKSFNFDINDNGDLVVVGLPYMYVAAKNETNNSENGGFISYTDTPSGNSVTGSGFITSSYYRKNIDASFPSSLGSGLGYSVSLNAKGDRLATIASDTLTSTSDTEFLQNSFFHVFESGNHNNGSCNYPNFWQELSINNSLEYPHSAIRLNGSGDALITFRSAFAGWREFARELPDKIFKYEYLYNSCANSYDFYRTATISETSAKVGLQKSLGQQAALSDNGTRILSTFNVPLVQCDGVNHSGSYKQYAEVYNVDPETSTEYSITNVQSISRVQCDENITQGDCLNNYLNSHWTSGVSCDDLNYCLDDDCLQLGHPNCTTTTTTTPQPPPTTTTTTTKEPFIFTTTTTTPSPPSSNCLTASNAVTFSTIDGVNSYVFGGSYDSYKTTTGTYVLTGVPSSHPIAILNNGKTSQISYTGTTSQGTKTALDGNSYEFFYGDITITVNSDYGTVSYECWNHGYMGGQNNLSYDASCTVSTTTTTTTLDPTDPCSSAPQIDCGNSLSGTTSIRLPYNCYSWFVDLIGAVTFEWDGWLNAYGRPADHPHKLNRFQVVVDGVVIFDTGTLTDSTGYSGSTTLQKTVSQSDVWYVRYYSDKTNNETHYYYLKLSCGSDPTTTTTTTTTVAPTTTTTTTTDGPTTTTTTTTPPTPPPDKHYGCGVSTGGEYNLQPGQCQRIIVEVGEDIGQVYFKWDSRMDVEPYYNRFYVKSDDNIIFDNNTLNNGSGLPSGEVYLDKTSASPTFWSVYVCKLSDTPVRDGLDSSTYDNMSWYMDCPTPAVPTTTTTTTTTTLAPCTVLATGNPNGYLFECCGEFGAQDWKQIGDTVYSFYEDDQMSQLRNSLMLHSNGSGVLTSAYNRYPYIVGYDSAGQGFSFRRGGVSSYAWDGQRWTKDMNDLILPSGNRSTCMDTSSSGDYLIAGDYIAYSGVYVYERSGTSWESKGSGIFWENMGELKHESSRNSQFGASVAINDAGTLIAVGARHASGSPMTDMPSHLRGRGYTRTVNGAVYIYDWNSSTSDWDQVGDTIVGDHYYSKLGHDIDLNTNGDILAVSAPAEYYNPSGYVAIYSRSGSNWSLKGSKISGSGTSDGGSGKFGWSISLNSLGDRLAISAPEASYSGIQVTGAWYDPNNASDDRLGYVAVYDWNGSDWSQVGNTITPKINLNLSRTRCHFGTAVKLNSSGNMLAILDKEAHLHSSYILEGSSWNLVANPVDLRRLSGPLGPYMPAQAYLQIFNYSSHGQYGGLGYSEDGFIMALPAKKIDALREQATDGNWNTNDGFSVWSLADNVESTFCDNAGTYFYHDPSLTYSSGNVLKIQPSFIDVSSAASTDSVTLKPNADGAVGGTWAIVGGAGSRNASISNGIDSPDDSKYTQSYPQEGQRDKTALFGFEDMPSDFGKATSGILKVRQKMGNQDGTCQDGAKYQLVESDGTTVLTNEISLCVEDISSSFRSDTYNLTVTGDTNKTSWDGAQLKVTHLGPGDGGDPIFSISEVQLELSYTSSSVGQNVFGQEVCIKIVDRVSGVPCEDLDLQFLSTHSNCEDCYDNKVIDDPPTTTTTTTTITTTTTTTTTTVCPAGTHSYCCDDNGNCIALDCEYCDDCYCSDQLSVKTRPVDSCDECEPFGACCYIPAGTSNTICGEMSQSQCAALPNSTFYQGRTCDSVNCEDCDCGWNGSDWVRMGLDDSRGNTMNCSFYEEFDGTLPCGDSYYIRYKCDKTIPAPVGGRYPPDPHKWEIMEVRFPCVQNFQWERSEEDDEDYSSWARHVGGCAHPPTWKGTAASLNTCNCCLEN